MAADTYTRFLSNVDKHELTILLDQDCHRHIRLAIPGSSVYHFNIVTWPGYLSISGDMGAYTFARVRDMFTFFRDPAMTNKINCQYWHEKAVAVDRDGGPKQFSQQRFKEAVIQDSDEWEVRLGDAQRIRDDITSELIDCHVANEHEAYQLIQEFEALDGQHFQDFEHNLMEWSFHFKWVLYAIVWGIKQYDLVTQERTQKHHDDRVLAGII